MKYIFTVLGLCLALMAHSQNKNIQLLGTKTYTNTTLHGSLSDVWGYVDSLGNEYAIVGLQKGVSIVDVTDPANMTEVFYVAGPSSIWRDIKTWDKHAYITNETSGGLTIIDMSALPGIITTGDVYYHTGTTYPFTRAHNLYIDENGFAYIFGSSYGKKGAIFLDLNQNPKIPTEAGVFDSLYFHDGMVRGDTLWGAAVYAGSFYIIDVSNKANPVILKSHNTSGLFAHNCWISDDGNTLFTTDEITGGAIGSYDVSDLSNIDELDLIWSNPGSGVIVHNTHVYGKFLVTSYYRDGVTVVDATQPDRMVQVGNYDTSPATSGNGFNGCWGAYPYLPSGNLLATDIENGLFVLGVNYQQGVYLEGHTRKFADSTYIAGTNIVPITTGGFFTSNLLGFYKESFVDSGLYRFAFSKPGYLPDTLDIFMSSGQQYYGDVYLRSAVPFKTGGRVIDSDSKLPVENAEILLEGIDLEYRVLTNAQGYFEVTSLYEGPYDITVGKWNYINACHQVNISKNDSLDFEIGSGIYDDFALDYGWSVTTNGTSGAWEIENFRDYSLAQTLNHVSYDVLSDCADFAFVTGASSSGDHDVDGGWNWLNSPAIDATVVSDPMLSFSYWFKNDAPTGTDDTLSFYLSDGQDTLELIKVHNAVNLYQSTWIDTSFILSLYALDLSNIQLLVRIGDFGNDDLLEAGLDHVAVTQAYIGIKEESKNNVPLKLYPNPVGNTLYYTVQKGFKPSRVEVTDIAGRLIFSLPVKGTSGQIDLSRIVTSGLLFVRFSDNFGNAQVRRIVKE
jgi:choice-of-anchor B domain-containing protein